MSTNGETSGNGGSGADLHTLTGAYAADALDPSERDEFELHLRECAECRQEVDELRATTARLAGASYEMPSPALRGRVLDEVGRTRQAPPQVDPRFGRAAAEAGSQPAVPWWRQPASIAAAFFLVAALGLGALAGVQWQRADEAQQRADRIAAVATDPNRVENNAPATTGGSGTVVAANDLAVFRTDDLPELPANRAYQLWLINDDGATSVGVLGRGGQLEMVMDDVSGATSVGLTVEPSGGSTQPTGDLVLQLPLES
jgi:anti-sigma-K factor RskA